MEEWVYGPEKITLEWRPKGRAGRFALDLTFYGPSAVTGRIECVEVALRSVPDVFIPVQAAEADVISSAGAAPVLASYLKSLQLSSRIDFERRKLAQLFQRMASMDVSSSSRAAGGRPFTTPEVARMRGGMVQTARAFGAETSKRPRSKIDSELLAEVADVYRRSIKRNAALAVSEHFRRPQSTTDKWIAEARRRGKLPKTRRGVVRA